MSKGWKTALIIIGIVVVILIVLPFVFYPMMGYQGDRYYGMGPGMMGAYGFGFFMPVLMIVFWGLVIWGVVSLIRGLEGETRESDSALELLKRRYARGEIGKEEFEAKKKDLA